jgi:hypothetical protein
LRCVRKLSGWDHVEIEIRYAVLSGSLEAGIFGVSVNCPSEARTTRE